MSEIQAPGERDNKCPTCGGPYQYSDCANREQPMSEVRKFRKKPVIIEAILFDGSEESIEAIRPWARGAEFSILRQPWGDKHAEYIEIPTLEGDMRAAPGEWIIKGVEGEFYPCKPGIFEKTYEVVNE